MEIRPLKVEDYPECARIYKDGLDTGIATFETEVPDWDTWDTKFLAVCRFVAVENDIILGWIALTLFSSRSVYNGVAEVSVYVASNARGKGIGRTLVLHCMESAKKQGFWTLQAKIFTLNTSSISLFEKCGFRKVGVRVKLGKRLNVWYDNMLMEKRF